MPILGIYGKGDKIVNPRQGELLKSVSDSRVEMLAESRHFPMLDEPQVFYSILLSYLNS
jgi:pimeloyl-ACP methyl ester carboxylesterase